MDLFFTLIIGGATFIINEVPDYLERRHETKMAEMQAEDAKLDAYLELCIKKDLCDPLFRELDIKDEQSLQITPQ